MFNYIHRRTCWESRHTLKKRILALVICSGNSLLWWAMGSLWQFQPHRKFKHNDKQLVEGGSPLIELTPNKETAINDYKQITIVIVWSHHELMSNTYFLTSMCTEPFAIEAQGWLIDNKALRLCHILEWHNC